MIRKGAENVVLPGESGSTSAALDFKSRLRFVVARQLHRIICWALLVKTAETPPGIWHCSPLPEACFAPICDRAIRVFHRCQIYQYLRTPVHTIASRLSECRGCHKVSQGSCIDTKDVASERQRMATVFFRHLRIYVNVSMQECYDSAVSPPPAFSLVFQCRGSAVSPTPVCLSSP